MFSQDRTHFLVRNMWHYNLNVNAPLSCILHTLIHLVINNKIRRHYISIFRRIVQIIYIRTLSDINFIKRSIAERYYKSVRTYGIFFDAWIYSPQSSMCSSFTFHISRNIAVNPDRLASEHKSRIFPMPETHLFINIFI